MNLISLYSVIVLFIAILLVAALIWSVRRQRRFSLGPQLPSVVEVPRGHSEYFSQVRQALEKKDLAYLKERGSLRILREVKKDRARVVLAYVSALGNDMDRLLRLAHVIAVLSPEVSPTKEMERFLLTLWFSVQCQIVRIKMFAGVATMPQLSALTEIVGELALRLERAMSELGERAALTAKMNSSLNG